MERIGRYEIIGEVGKGAMGVVYRAADPNIGRTVAIKTLRIDIHGTENEEILGRFKNEARAAGMMNHANIITIYDAGEQEGMFYIAMEFIEGQTLQGLLKQAHALPVEKATNIVRQVCSGLDYAHARGIIHRDIKPANIMITGDGTVKIMDFGIAKSGGTGMTSTGQVVGTPNYMSPEQVKGKPLDGRTDLFSVGVVLYEMLTGTRPFGGENVTSIIYKILHENPPAPRDLVEGIHPGLSAVVMKALAKSPEERFATGAEFGRAVQEYGWFKAETVRPAPEVIRFDSKSDAMASPFVSAPGSAVAAKLPVKAEPAPDARAAVKSTPVLDSTVSAPRQPDGPPAPAKSGRLPAIAAAVLLVALAVGAYVGLHRSAPPATPPAADVNAGKVSPPAATEAANGSTARAGKHRSGGKEVARGAADGAKATPADLGDLQISSTPFGAKVTIDGKTDPDWVTPFAAKRLKPGRHTVGFTFKGYQPATRQADVVAGTKLPLYVQLQVAQGFLVLNSDPAGAAIYIDGSDSGQVTPARITVNAGKHRVALRKEGFKPRVTYADVALGESFNFAPALAPGGEQGGQPAMSSAPAGQGSNPFRRLRRLFGKDPSDSGVLEVRTRPRGADIRLGTTPAPSKSPAKFAVAPGNYTLTLSLPGYKPITRPVQIEKGKMMGVDEVFEPQ
ncbi:MAG TPA: protein kinase [Terriglobales bacterium]